MLSHISRSAFISAILTLNGFSPVYGRPRGQANGLDQANAYEVVLLDDDYVKLTVYYYNDYDVIETDKKERKRVDHFRGDTELVIKRAQEANVQFGFCINIEPNALETSSSNQSGGFQQTSGSASSKSEDDSSDTVDPFQFGQFDDGSGANEVSEE